VPEYEGHKISRADWLARYAYGRELVRELRQEAKGSDWKISGGSLFRDYKGWFVSVLHGVIVFWQETIMYMHIKPMGIDPLFWDLLGMPENRRKSLSFRGQGAWTCRPVEFAYGSLKEDGMDAARNARRIVEWADQELEKARPDLTTDRFLDRLRAAPEQVERGRLSSSLIMTLLAAGREEEAEQVCNEEIARGTSGGFFPAQGTFPMAALEHIRAVSAGRTGH
jgi:hypothetical protein